MVMVWVRSVAIYIGQEARSVRPAIYLPEEPPLDASEEDGEGLTHTPREAA